jgi:hypothetical protein
MVLFSKFAFGLSAVAGVLAFPPDFELSKRQTITTSQLAPMVATSTPSTLMVAALLTTPMATAVNTVSRGRMMATLPLARDGILVAHSKLTF